MLAKQEKPHRLLTQKSATPSTTVFGGSAAADVPLIAPIARMSKHLVIKEDGRAGGALPPVLYSEASYFVLYLKSST